MLRILLAPVTLGVALIGSGALAQTKPAPAASPMLARAQFISDMDSDFRKMDADKNGQLTRTEIEQFQKLQLVAQAQRRNVQLFSELDADKNGQISPAEFAKLVQASPAANGQPMLARMDGNHDQQVSLIEHRTATVANFDRLDLDKDGFVSAAEMKAGGITAR